VKKQYLILVAGGTGSRMNSALPKQFMEIKGQPVIIRTLRCFLQYNSAMHIIISVHADFQELLKNLLDQWGLTKAAAIHITTGGATRFNSVKNGLQLVTDPDAIVAIHDAARPFVSQQTIKNCFEGALQHGNATPCVPVAESLRRVIHDSNAAVNRGEYRIVQTPQCFLASKIKKAFEQEYAPEFTDDATVLESTGERIYLVEGNPENIKITNPHDLWIATSIINNEQ
jgi:2-C-methyl-D-erythritol 4-phosphate cytidylyltransferase